MPAPWDNYDAMLAVCEAAKELVAARDAGLDELRHYLALEQAVRKWEAQ